MKNFADKDKQHQVCSFFIYCLIDASSLTILSIIASCISDHFSSSLYPPMVICFFIRQALLPSNLCHSKDSPKLSSIDTLFLSSKQEEISSLENLGLHSARCNQHIQSSMNIEELMVYGGILAQRMSNVLTARKKLFDSTDWKELIGGLDRKA